jgi:membrane associated rhomboid family serine protease
VNDWALVLEAAAIGHRVDERDDHFALAVDPADVTAAEGALAGFDEEGAPEQLPPAPDLGWSPLGIACAIGFLAMLLVTGTADGQSVWFQVGSADAYEIMHGAWWRAVTALTLHVDMFHVVSNVIACLVFVSSVGRWLGGGLGVSLILLSATAGNLLNAVYHRANHHSVGASTATFAALGIIAALQAVRRLHLRTRPGYWWLPIGAGLALFAMTGASRATDYRAHLFGLGFGVLFGAGWAFAQLKRGWRAPRPLVQALLAAAALAVVAGCWLLAFRYPA